MSAFRDVAGIPDHLSCKVYEHCWQSWSPTGLCPAVATTPRPARGIWQTMAFRPGRAAPATGAQGEGLLAVVDASGAATIVSADGDVHVRATDAELLTALEQWADTAAAAAAGPSLRSLPAG